MGRRYGWRDGSWVDLTALRESREALERFEAEHRSSIERLESDGARAQRIYDSTPTWHELKREFPKLDVIEHEDGSRSADMRHMTEEDKRLLGEMYGERRAWEVEKSEDLSARVETVRVGKRVVPAAKAEKVERAMRERA